MRIFASLLFGVVLLTSATPVYADDTGRIAFCAVTTPVRIVARLFGADESQYCTPWKKNEIAARKAARNQVAAASADGSKSAEMAAQPAILTAQATK